MFEIERALSFGKRKSAFVSLLDQHVTAHKSGDSEILSTNFVQQTSIR